MTLSYRCVWCNQIVKPADTEHYLWCVPGITRPQQGTGSGKP